MTDYSAFNREHAIYTFALNDAYNTAAIKPDAEFRNGVLPPALPSVHALNFLDPGSALFHTDHVLVSYGQYIGKNTPAGMFTNCDRSRVTIIGDSGGYQFAKGTKPWNGDTTRREALDWLEKHTDIAMTLDIPTLALSNPTKTGFSTFQQCLDITLESLDYFANHRTGTTRFLNVLQGRDQKEADNWEKAVISYPFNGWAFAGPMRLDPYEVCRRIIRLINAGKINGVQNHLHVLGTGRLDIAVLLTALQNALRKRLGCPSIVITFDSATPGLILRGYGAMTHADLTKDRFRISNAKPPRGHQYIGSSTPFPFRSSTLGRTLRIGDICVKPDHIKQSSWDMWTAVLLTNHSLNALLDAIVSANSIVSWNAVDAEETAPTWIVGAVRAVHRVFESADPMKELRNQRRAFENFMKATLGGEAEPERSDYSDGD